MEQKLVGPPRDIATGEWIILGKATLSWLPSPCLWPRKFTQHLAVEWVELGSRAQVVSVLEGKEVLQMFGMEDAALPYDVT